MLYQAEDGFRLVDDDRRQRPRNHAAAHVDARRRRRHVRLFTPARLFDGRTARENVDIVIEGNRIARIEPHRADLHSGTVVDASNGTVLPGLIESHAHLSPAYGERFGRIWLAFGITTVRNPAVDAFEGQEVREIVRRRSAHRPAHLHDGRAVRRHAHLLSRRHGARRRRRRSRRSSHARKKLGYDFIKTYVRLPDLLQRRVIDEAHRLACR